MPLTKNQKISSPGTGNAGRNLLTAIDKATKPSKPTTKITVAEGFVTIGRQERRFRVATLHHLEAAGLIAVNAKRDRLSLTPAGKKFLGA